MSPSADRTSPTGEDQPHHGRKQHTEEDRICSSCGYSAVTLQQHRDTVPRKGPGPHSATLFYQTVCGLSTSQTGLDPQSLGSSLPAPQC